MADELDAILRLVADGKLTPEEAEPLIAALGEERRSSRTAPPTPPSPSTPPTPPTPPGPPTPPSPPSRARGEPAVRIAVTERGRQVVNLRIPLGMAGVAASMVPGLSDSAIDRIREAFRSGTVGRILDVEDEDGDGVVISME